MVLSEQTEVRYVPYANGNHKAEKESQVVFVLELPTVLERHKWRTTKYSSAGKRKGLEFEIDTNLESVISKCVKSIENLKLKQSNGTERSGRTTKEALECTHPVVSEMLTEVANMVLVADEIPEEEVKK